MTTLTRIQKYSLVLLSLIACQGISQGQTLYDVVISISDRHRVITQRGQVTTHLENENNRATDPDSPIPEDQPIDWVEDVGTSPTQSSVEGLDMGGKIALLNQAIVEFGKIKASFLNIRPADLTAGGTTGALRPYMQEDFPALERVTAENFPVLLATLARQVRHLTVIPWSASLKKREKSSYKRMWEKLDNGNVITDPNSDQLGSWQPTTLSDGDFANDNPRWLTVNANDPYTFNVEWVSSSGIYQKTTYHNGPPNGKSDYQLQSVNCGQWTTFFSDARMVVAPPTVTGTLQGRVVLVVRNEYSSAKATSFSSLPDTWKPDNGVFHVVVVSPSGGGDAVLSASGPGILVKLTWSELEAAGEDVVASYGRMDCDRSPESWNYRDLLERRFYPLFVPSFTRGLDATGSGIPEALAQSARTQRPPSGDGQVTLHPQPGLMIGVPLGVGIDGDDSPGWIGLSPGSYDFLSGMNFSSLDMFGCGIISPGFTSYGGYSQSELAIRFDYSSNLRFVGAAEDFHVVYATKRTLPERGSTLPLVQPSTAQFEQSGWEDQSVLTAWDLPRIRQIVGRDLIADISTQGHYKTTVKIYRRPANAGPVVRTSGHLEDVDALTPIRTLVFENPNNSGNELFYNSPEILRVTDGSNTYTATRSGLIQNGGTITLASPTHEKTLTLSGDETNGYGATVSQTLDGVALGTSVLTGDPEWRWWKHRTPASIVHTPTAGTARTYTLTKDTSPGCRDGSFPKTLTATGGDQLDQAMTWNDRGQLVTASDGNWNLAAADSSGVWKSQVKLGNAVVGTTWTEFIDGTKKVKTYSAPDGGTDNKDGTSVAWSEVEYGTASSGLPGLPHVVKNSDGTGATYGWNVSADGSYTLTLEEGLLASGSVSRGTKSVRSIDSRGYPSDTKMFWINGNLQIAGTTFSEPNAWGAPEQGSDFNTGLHSTWAHDGDMSRISSFNSGLGINSTFSNFDSIGRARSINTNGIIAAMDYTAFSTTAMISGGATGSIVETRDTLGRLTSSNTTWNSVTDNLAVTPNTSPVAITRTQSLLGTHNSTVRKDDGTVAATSGPTLPFGGTEGTALAVEDGLLRTKSELGEQANAYRTTWTDAWGRVSKTETSSTAPSDTDETGFIYSDPDSSVKRVRVTQASGRVLITESDPYNASGMIRRSGIDVNGNGSLGTSDRFVESVTTVSGGTLVTTLSLTEDTGLREILRTAWTPSGGQTVTTINGSEETITRTPNYTAKTVTTSSTKGWSKTDTFNNLGLTTNSTLSGTGVPSAALTPVWRDDGSLSGVTFTAGGETHSASFNNDGTLATLTAPGKGNILGGHSVSGGIETLTVDGVTTITKLDGTETATSGGDVIGKTEELATSGSGFKQTTTPTVGAATEVTLNAAGAPTAKAYAAGAGESYTSYKGGLIHTVSLARGGDLTFGYSNDGAKDLTSATWPAVVSGQAPNAFNIPSVVQSYGHDRAGRVDEIGDSSGARTISWQNGRTTGSAYTAGALSGYELLTPRNAQGTGTGFTAKRSGIILHSTTRVPNGASGEVSEIISGDVKIVINRNAARQVTGFQCGNTTGTFVPVVTQTWERGPGGRIEYAGSNITGAPSFDYLINPAAPEESFDAKGRRLKCATAGGQWTYQYTNGQLSSAVHPSLGNFSYQFDGIGRRTDMGTANISDVLNRTLAWTNNQNKTLKVAAHPDARVWVGIGAATPAEIPSFTGAYSYPITPPGSSGGWVAWNTLAVLEGEGDAGANPDAKAEQSGAVWVPPVNESFTFDAAGNRESSALWNYGWDAKNQLVHARTKNHNTAALGYDITNAYDAEGRRFSKKVNRYQNGAIAEQKVITFLHDGDDLIYERHQLPSGLTTLERKYVWGPDISGAHGGAGGAGGLLLIRETRGNATVDLYPLYDGSGHVVALTDASGVLQAEYAYSPFGESIYARGPYASSCPFRFQTKYHDQETGLYCFKHRPYDPITNQWLSRDPLGEKEDINLYRLTGGDPINFVDVNGLAKVATDGRGNLTALGQVILDVAKGDPNAARSLLMAAQVSAETSGIKVAKGNDKDALRTVMESIETAVGQAQSDGRREWQLIAAEAGLSGESSFGGYKDAWMTTKLAEYAPQIAANAQTAIELRAAEHAANEKITAYQNSASYKIREFLDVPFDVAAFGISAAAATDVTTGNAVTWNSLNNGGGFGLEEVTPGQRAFATSMVFLPIGRVGGIADDIVRVGTRGKSFAGTALNPWRVGGFNPTYWNMPIEQGGRRVFQRGDLFEATVENLALMRKGRPPIGLDGEAVNLHHLIQREPGSIAEVAGSFHSQNTGILHGLTESKRSFRYSPDGRTTDAEKAFRRWSYQYWQDRATGF